MADDTPPEPQHRPPVRMGLRVAARHSAGRHGGRVLAEQVVETHRPKLLDAATRLARNPAPPARLPRRRPLPPHLRLRALRRLRPPPRRRASVRPGRRRR